MEVKSITKRYRQFRGRRKREGYDKTKKRIKENMLISKIMFLFSRSSKTLVVLGLLIVEAS
jgi:hypothetical protein